MNSYVINLSSATDRMDRMWRIFAAAEIPIIRFEAIDRERAAAHPLKALVPPKRFREWTLGELGCLLSHFEIWRLIADGDEPFGAVFEDDVHIDPRLREFLNQPLPAEADLVKLETVNLNVRVGRQPRATVSSVGLHTLRTLHTGAGAYVLSRRAARLLVDRLTTFDMPADHLLFELDHPASAGFVRYQCIPALAVQDCVLPDAEQKGGVLSSNMSDRPIWAPETTIPSLADRFVRAPATLPRRIAKRALLSITTRSGGIAYNGPLQG